MTHSLKLPSVPLILLSIVMGGFAGLVAMNFFLAWRIGVPFDQVTPFLWFEASDVIRRLHAPAFAESLTIGGAVGVGIPDDLPWPDACFHRLVLASAQDGADRAGAAGDVDRGHDLKPLW